MNMNMLKRYLKLVTTSLKNIKVNFIIGGTQKGGTSALDAYLRTHPEICMANRKEVHFFDNETNFRNKRVNYLKYHSFFNPKPHHRLVGEATPIYTYWQDAPKRIWQYNPSMKLIVVLRNPVQRAFSHWNMERDRDADKLEFWDAIQREQERCKEALPYQHRVYSYVDRGFYTEQLRRIWRFFPEDQILILKNEDLWNEPKVTLNKVCNFLQLSCFKHVDKMKIHCRPYVSSMSSQERAYLLKIYEHEIKALERMLEWDCSNWLA